MTTDTLSVITREEFDRRLGEINRQRDAELRRIEGKQAQVETVLAHYEQMLDEVEASLAAGDGSPSHTALLRYRLQQLATKTAEVAMLL